MVIKVLSWIAATLLLVGLIWIVTFGFIKTEYSHDTEIPCPHSKEQVFDFLSDPNRFPQWIRGFERSRRVSTPKESNKKMYLLTIEDENELNVIFSSTRVDSMGLLQQKVEHPFYNLEVAIKEKKSKTELEESKITIEFHLEPAGFFERVLSPFYVSAVLSDFEDQYRRGIAQVK